MPETWSDISIQGLKDFINKEVVLVESRIFIPGTQFRGRGITAEQFEAILTAYVKALNARTPDDPIAQKSLHHMRDP